MKRPQQSISLRHVALLVKDLEACVNFYVNLLGMHEEWKPDPDNVYLTSGVDNLALHRAPAAATVDRSKPQSLDHIGFIIQTEDAVDEWFKYLKAHDVPMKTQPRKHRDGAKSFYCLDPDGNTVQMIYHPPLVGL